MSEPIKLPLTYESRRGNLRDGDGLHIGILTGWSEGESNPKGEYIVQCVNEHASLTRDLAAEKERREAAEAELAREREFICKKCGLRQELGEKPEVSF